MEKLQTDLCTHTFLSFLNHTFLFLASNLAPKLSSYHHTVKRAMHDIVINLSILHFIFLNVCNLNVQTLCSSDIR